MTEIVIAGDFPLPRDVAPGQTLTISGSFKVYSANLDLIDVSSLGGEPETLDGDTQLKTVAIDIKVARP